MTIEALTLAEVQAEEEFYVFTEEDYKAYQVSVGRVVKLIWIIFQVVMMTQFMIRGLVFYAKVTSGITKVKLLLIFQGCQFLYMLINEFIWHNMTGMYMNLLLCAYGHFLTFCVVMDSCVSDHDNTKATRTATRVGRIFFHSFFVILVCCVFAARSCDNHLYPVTFVLVGLYIFFHQVYDVCLYCFDYLIDWENIPP